MNTPPFKRVLEYQSDDFQTKQRPPQEFPPKATQEITLSGTFQPFLKTSSTAIMKRTLGAVCQATDFNGQGAHGWCGGGSSAQRILVGRKKARFTLMGFGEIWGRHEELAFCSRSWYYGRGWSKKEKHRGSHRV